MRRLNIDLELAVAAIQDEKEITPNRLSNLIRASSVRKKFAPRKSVGSDSDYSNISRDLKNFSLDLRSSSSAREPKNMAEIKRRKKLVPPPLPDRARNKLRLESSKLKLAPVKAKLWPPTIEKHQNIPLPDQKKPRSSVVVRIKKNIGTKRKEVAEPCEIFTWSKVSQVLLPPPEPKKVPKNKIALKASVERENAAMATEDWRSHLVRLEKAELDLLKDIDQHEMKLKELDKKLNKAVKLKKHKTANIKPKPRVRLRHPSAAPRLVDSYRFSVRSQSKAPFSVNE